MSPSLAYLKAKAIIRPAPVGVKVKGPCWIWPNVPTSDGYGTINWNGTTHRVHRVAYAANGGELDDSLKLDHLCTVRNCFNPAHLEQVTQRVNLLRSPKTLASRHAAKTHCKNGHPFDAANTIIINAERGWRDCRACRLAKRERAKQRRRSP